MYGLRFPSSSECVKPMTVQDYLHRSRTMRSLKPSPLFPPAANITRTSSASIRAAFVPGCSDCADVDEMKLGRIKLTGAAPLELL